MAFPIASGAENTFAKKPVAFGLQSAIVNGFGLFNFAERPLADFIRGGEPNPHGVENIDIEHSEPPLRDIGVRNEFIGFRID